MMVMTAKVDIRKVILILAAVAGIVIGLILLLRGGAEEPAASTAAPASVSDNDARVRFLTEQGWDVAASPVETSQVKIPEQTTEVFDRYNALQKSQGYDLSQYAGKSVMRFVYKVNNYPGATEPVYATLLVYKNQIIGGDVTDTAAKGHIRGFKMPEPAASAPTETTFPIPSATQPQS